MKLEEYLPMKKAVEGMAKMSLVEATADTTSVTSASTAADTIVETAAPVASAAAASASLYSQQQKQQPGITLTSPEACSTLKFEDFYQVQEKIAKGSFGTVFVAKHKPSGEEFAVKVMDRKKLSEREMNGVVREVTILRDCRDVQHIVRLVDFFASPKHFFVVQVYAQGGDLFARIASSSSYNEKDARDLAQKLLQAMQVLHERKIVHRDLKPENLLLQDLLDDTKILIADFGFARYVPKEGLRTRCGSKYCRRNEGRNKWGGAIHDALV